MRGVLEYRIGAADGVGAGARTFIVKIDTKT